MNIANIVHATCIIKNIIVNEINCEQNNKCLQEISNS